MDSGLGGVNTTVAQIEAQLENASWELLQTTIGAPADGYVPVVALTVGDRALQASSVMSFIVENKIAFVGMLSQNGPQDDKDRRSSRYRFRHPGCIYRAKISVIQKISARSRSPHPGMIGHQRDRRCNSLSGGDLNFRMK